MMTELFLGGSRGVGSEHAAPLGEVLERAAGRGELAAEADRSSIVTVRVAGTAGLRGPETLVTRARMSSVIVL
jgi:hypothetical protein